MTTTELTATDRYTVISVDGHAGAALQDYKPYLAARWHDEFDAWAAGYVNPFADLLAATAYRNWDSDRRLEETESQGRRCRGVVPEHDPAVLRAGQPHRARARPRPTTNAGGPACRRTTAGSPTSARRRRAGAPAARRSSSTTSTTRSPRSAGRRRTCTCSAACCSRTSRRTRRCRRSGIRTTSRSGSCARSSTSSATSTREAACPTSATHEAARAIMLIELAWYAHRAVWHLIFGGVLERHPSLARRAHRTGDGLDPARLDTLDWFHRRMTHGGAAEAVFFGAVAKQMSLTPDRVLPAQLLGRRELPAPVGERRSATTSASIASCGAPTTRTPKAAIRTRPKRCAPRSRRARRPRRRRWSRRTRPRCTASTSPRCARSANESGRPSPKCWCRSIPPTIPTDSTCNAFDAEQVIKAW